VLVLASGVAAVTRYVALRTWVFARSRNRAQTLQPAVPTDQGSYEFLTRVTRESDIWPRDS
jgi:hypothetical protein